MPVRLLTLLAVVALGASGCRGDGAPRPVEWTLIFLLPNDNDLAPQAERIEAELRLGVVGEHAAVTLLVDDAGDAGLRRVAVTESGVDEARLESDDVTSPAVFERFLRWSAERHPARHFGLLLLGHGGRVDEIALDERRGPGRDAGWASAAAFADATRQWSSSLDGSTLELLVLQQCGRGSVEGLWAFRETAPLVMASETFVGAPNTYYQPLAALVSSRPLVEPEDLVRTILERDRHAATLAVIDGARLAELPAALDRLADSFGEEGRLVRPGDQVPTFLHDGEVDYDLCAWTRSLARANGIDSPEVEAALRWFERRLVLGQRFRRVWYRGVEFPHVEPTWCGVSTVTPSMHEEAAVGQPLPIHELTRWGEVAKRLAPPRMLLGAPEVTTLPAGSAPVEAPASAP